MRPRILASVILLMATALPPIAAQTWPATVEVSIPGLRVQTTDAAVEAGTRAYLAAFAKAHQDVADGIRKGQYKKVADYQAAFVKARQDADKVLVQAIATGLKPAMAPDGVTFASPEAAATVYDQIAATMTAPVTPPAPSPTPPPGPVPTPGPTPPGPSPSPTPGGGSVADRLAKVAEAMETSAAEMRRISKDMEKLKAATDVLNGIAGGGK